MFGRGSLLALVFGLVLTASATASSRHITSSIDNDGFCGLTILATWTPVAAQAGGHLDLLWEDLTAVRSESVTVGIAYDNIDGAQWNPNHAESADYHKFKLTATLYDSADGVLAQGSRRARLPCQVP